MIVIIPVELVFKTDPTRHTVEQQERYSQAGKQGLSGNIKGYVGPDRERGLRHISHQVCKMYCGGGEIPVTDYELICSVADLDQLEPEGNEYEGWFSAHHTHQLPLPAPDSPSDNTDNTDKPDTAADADPLAPAMTPTRFERLQQQLVYVLGVDEKEVRNNSDFVKDLGADSLDAVEITMAVEEEFNIEIPDEDYLDNKNRVTLCSVADLLTYLTKRLGPEFPDAGGCLRLTEEQFIERYRPRMEDGSYVQYEWASSAGANSNLVTAVHERRCWTMLETDGEWFIEWGNRVVNRLFNIITFYPLEDENWHVDVEMEKFEPAEVDG